MRKKSKSAHQLFQPGLKALSCKQACYVEDSVLPASQVPGSSTSGKYRVVAPEFSCRKSKYYKKRGSCDDSSSRPVDVTKEFIMPQSASNGIEPVPLSLLINQNFNRRKSDVTNFLSNVSASLNTSHCGKKKAHKSPTRGKSESRAQDPVRNLTIGVDCDRKHMGNILQTPNSNRKIIRRESHLSFESKSHYSNLTRDTAKTPSKVVRPVKIKREKTFSHFQDLRKMSQAPDIRKQKSTTACVAYDSVQNFQRNNSVLPPEDNSYKSLNCDFATLPVDRPRQSQDLTLDFDHLEDGEDVMTEEITPMLSTNTVVTEIYESPNFTMERKFDASKSPRLLSRQMPLKKEGKKFLPLSLPAKTVTLNKNYRYSGFSRLSSYDSVDSRPPLSPKIGPRPRGQKDTNLANIYDITRSQSVSMVNPKLYHRSRTSKNSVQAPRIFPRSPITPKVPEETIYENLEHLTQEYTVQYTKCKNIIRHRNDSNHQYQEHPIQAQSLIKSYSTDCNKLSLTKHRLVNCLKVIAEKDTEYSSHDSGHEYERMDDDEILLQADKILRHYRYKTVLL